MKNSFKNLLAIAFVFSSFTVFAGGKGGFGVKGGLAISTIGLETESAGNQKNRMRLGGTGGISYEVATEKSFAFDVEAIYDLRGTKEEKNGGITYKNYVHYLSMPLSFKFYIGDVFNVNFGGYAGYAIGGKIKGEADSPLGEAALKLFLGEDMQIPYKDLDDSQGDEYLNKLDAGIHAGLEFVSKKGIGVGGRFSKGLVDITNDDHVLGGNNSLTTELSIYGIFRF